MAAPLGQPVVIENISAASGVLGVERAANYAKAIGFKAD